MKNTKKKAEWIWYYGDYEIMQLNRCLTSRYEREMFIPPFWRMDVPYANVTFIKEFSLSKPEQIVIRANRHFNVSVARGEGASEYIHDFDGTLRLDPGKYKLTVAVYNEDGLPALYVDGETVKSDATFLVSCNDLDYIQAGCDGLTDPDCPPSAFRFELAAVDYKILEKKRGSVLIDCGAEMMAKVRVGGAAEGFVRIYYGESLAEARSKEGCELTDSLDLSKTREVGIAKACRYIYMEGDEAALSAISVEREYRPTVCRSNFRCSDGRLNRIYEVALETLALNTREFYLDGLKRDRWVWGGDAYQTYLMSYYSFFDVKTVKRTMIALAGKEPVTAFVNHIMDYSFLWVIGLWDFYRYVGDTEFLKKMLPVAKSFLRLAETRRDEHGLLVGDPRDWVFLDWANLDNRGEVAAEQILFWKALDVTGKLCELMGEDGSRYFARRDELKKALFDRLWDGKRGVFYHTRTDAPATEIKKHAHIFALLFGILDGAQTETAERVLTDPSVEAIVTPYMRLYELETLCKLGKRDYVLDAIRSYWGGMLDEGATTFWERYDPSEKGDEKYAMYGKPFGRSLCHTWGAGAIYLLGRYYAGLEPAEPGYATFRLRPYLGDLEWMECVLPAGDGSVEISLSREAVRVRSDGKRGTLYLDCNIYELKGGYDGIEDGFYVIPIEAGVPAEIALKLRAEEV